MTIKEAFQEAGRRQDTTTSQEEHMDINNEEFDEALKIAVNDEYKL